MRECSKYASDARAPSGVPEEGEAVFGREVACISPSAGANPRRNRRASGGNGAEEAREEEEAQLGRNGNIK